MTAPLTLFQARADPTHLRILALLRAMDCRSAKSHRYWASSQPCVSRHVKILVNAGLADRRKEGSGVFLTLGAPAIVAPILAAIDGWPPKGEGEQQVDLARLKAARATAAEDYFETYAANWDALRSLHVVERDVEAAIERLLAPEPIGRMVDIGTGTGRMMELLGAKAASAIGFDRSPAMLRLARTKLAQPASGPGSDPGSGDAELRQGDMYALPLPDGAADFAIMHQVLHYAQHPAAAIAEAARVLAPRGRLLIVDFASHDREDLRERDAHVRLGFTDQQIRDWFAAAGLASSPPVHLDSELTVKLWLGRHTASPAAWPAFSLLSLPRNRRHVPVPAPPNPGLSLEFFPPKTPKMTDALRQTALVLAALGPLFISVTYGAGGSTRDRTVQTVAALVREI